MDSCRTEAGVFDMSGNVSEWGSACTNSPDSESAGDCLTRGGSFIDTSAEALGCASSEPGSFSLPLGSTSRTLGIRCCKD
jgi:formylglycine-generating enzyme required for sulfatase activity